MRSGSSLPSTPVLAFVLGLFGAYVVLQAFLFQLPAHTPFHPLDVAFWAALIWIARRSAVRLPLNASMSHLFVVSLAAAVAFPPWLAPLLVFVFSFNQDFGKPSYPWYKDLFNRSQFALATGLAAWVWGLVQAQPGNPYVLEGLGILAASLTYFWVNVSAVTYIIHLSSGLSLGKVWFENYSWLWASYLLQAPIGLLLAKAYQTPLIWGWGGFTVLFIMLLLYFSRYYWDEKVQLEKAFDNTIEVLIATLDAKDPFTRMHSERVAAISRDIGKRMGLDEGDLKRLTYAARIHDIGKLAVPDSILLKPKKLSKEEFDLVKKHPAKGLEVLHPMLHLLAKNVKHVILYHHERWDGAGYPMGLKGEKIPLWARIVSLADAYEAMTAGRSYAPAKTPQAALDEIMAHAGTQFDPQVVEAFKKVWLEDPIWKDREEFLRRYTSPVLLSVSSSPSPSEPASATSATSSSDRPGPS
ncbi:HD-GYP domain-containing protein [Meiothermus rufus]|uniref:HD-GYP domain-containing protein n=1 Tax=Meiothermus rufus TaxID=604332 RepID=UPI0004860A96|nr:HD-GYP domain-containing protein [Meiothermus rufus]